MSQPPQTKVIKARTKQGKRILEQRAPKLVCLRNAMPELLPHVNLRFNIACALRLQVEDPKRALILFGNKTSQTVKDILTDIHKLKGV